MTMLFSQLATQFLCWAAKCKRPSTVAVYRHYLRRFVEHHGDLPASDIRPAHVTEFAKTWHQAQAVKRLFRWAVTEAGVLEKNYIGSVKQPPKGQRRRILTPRESAAFLRAASRDLRELLIAHRETMARPEELRRASWPDVRSDLPAAGVVEALTSQRACIVLYDFKNRDARGNTEAPRIILLSPRACRLMLRIHRRQTHPRGLIFQTARARAWTPNAVRCRFRRLRVQLGIERDARGETIVPYTFRHTGATMAAAAGVRDRALADVLGHVETKTTARYQHLLTEHLRAALSPLWTPKREKRPPRIA
jgi:integrase